MELDLGTVRNYNTSLFFAVSTVDLSEAVKPAIFFLFGYSSFDIGEVDQIFLYRLILMSVWA